MDCLIRGLNIEHGRSEVANKRRYIAALAAVSEYRYWFGDGGVRPIRFDRGSLVG